MFAPGQAIESSLKQLAERRTDIFGVGEEAAQEAAIGKKMGEEERRAGQLSEDGSVVDAPPQVVTWDGHSSSAESVAAKARANVTINEQIEQIQRQKGMMAEKEKIGPKVTDSPQPQPRPPVPSTATISAPPVQQPAAATAVMAPPVAAAPPPPPPVPLPPPQQPPMMMQQPVMAGLPGAAPPAFFVAATPGFPPMPAPPPPQAGPPMVDLGGASAGPPAPVAPAPPAMPPQDEPPAKRPRGEDHLMPESDFLAHHAHLGPVSFHVVCPASAAGGASEWRLNGQTVVLSLPLTDTVSVIKAR